MPSMILKLNKNNEGLLTSSDVQYVAKGYNFIKTGLFLFR